MMQLLSDLSKNNRIIKQGQLFCQNSKSEQELTLVYQVLTIKSRSKRKYTLIARIRKIERK